MWRLKVGWFSYSYTPKGESRKGNKPTAPSSSERGRGLERRASVYLWQNRGSSVCVWRTWRIGVVIAVVRAEAR